MSRRKYDVRGRTAIVTGAARGIGAETAKRLHSKGANVVLCGLEPDELAARAAELGDRAAWLAADVTDLDAMQAVAQHAVDRFGGIDIVVANAGVAPNGTIASIDPAAFDRTIEVNLLGVFRTVKATLPHVTARRGYFLLISSASALVHTPLMAAYTASKAGVEAFGDALRAELAHTGAKVGVAYFSFLDTDMVRRSFERESAKHGRERMSGFGKVAPLSEGIDAIERGIDRRARHVYAPREVGPLIWLRSLAQPLSELQVRRSKDFRETLRLAEAEESELTTAQPTPTARAPQG
jgi:NAD(P)-dependent dehydrogenase (short-subunit alcohol dehydrogenase family)